MTKKEELASALASVSMSLCLMSLAMAKKTSSTLRFVLALCRGRFPTQGIKKERIFKGKERDMGAFKQSYPPSRRTSSRTHRRGPGPSRSARPVSGSIREMNEESLADGGRGSAYPLAVVHVGLVPDQNLVDVVGSMLFDVPNPVPYICRCIERAQ